MNRPDADEATRLPVPSDNDLQARVADLLDCAIRRQWWTLFLDERDVQFPLVMPMADYPDAPDDPAPECGTAAELLANRLAMITREIDAAKLVFVWERPGTAESTPADRAWARALGEACRAEGIAVRAQLILHDDGVRWFAPDDYV
ncbi:hypothetical protein ACWGST_16960 [Agromyces sp. NPDC055520]